MVFIDAIMVKIRDGKVANRPIYVAIGVTAGGERDILGLWAGEGRTDTGRAPGEGAKFWQQVLTEIKTRGVEDVLMLVCRRTSRGYRTASGTCGRRRWCRPA